MGVQYVIEVSEVPSLTEYRLVQALERSSLSDPTYDSLMFKEAGSPWTIHISNRWTIDETVNFAEDITSRHRGSQCRITEEWDTEDADHPGSEISVYADGHIQTDLGMVNGMVPVDLKASVAAVRRALSEGVGLAPAAQWLIDGLSRARRHSAEETGTGPGHDFAPE
ncbi:hypothetical protein [Flaviflexus sp.]|uniref:hypothetical protein n=1 Tax=Flaviflexus sp. TaxID=1969482 RepID=UPI003F8E0006